MKDLVDLFNEGNFDDDTWREYEDFDENGLEHLTILEEIETMEEQELF